MPSDPVGQRPEKVQYAVACQGRPSTYVLPEDALYGSVSTLWEYVRLTVTSRGVRAMSVGSFDQLCRTLEAKRILADGADLSRVTPSLKSQVLSA